MLVPLSKQVGAAHPSTCVKSAESHQARGFPPAFDVLPEASVTAGEMPGQRAGCSLRNGGPSSWSRRRVRCSELNGRRRGIHVVSRS